MGAREDLLKSQAALKEVRRSSAVDDLKASQEKLRRLQDGEDIEESTDSTPVEKEAPVARLQLSPAATAVSTEPTLRKAMSEFQWLKSPEDKARDLQAAKLKHLTDTVGDASPEYVQNVAETVGPLIAKGKGFSFVEGPTDEDSSAAGWKEAGGKHGKVSDIPANALRELQGMGTNILTAGLSTAKMLGSAPDLVESYAARITGADKGEGWTQAQLDARRKERRKTLDEFVTAAEGGGLLPLTFIAPGAGKLGAALGNIVKGAAVAPTLAPTVEFVEKLADDPVNTAIESPLSTGLLTKGIGKGTKTVAEVVSGRYVPKTAAPLREAPSWYARSPDVLSQTGEVAYPGRRPPPRASEVPVTDITSTEPVTRADGRIEATSVRVRPDGEVLAKLTPSQIILSQFTQSIGGKPGPDILTSIPKFKTKVGDVLAAPVEALMRRYPGLEAWVPMLGGERQAAINQAWRAGIGPNTLKALEGAAQPRTTVVPGIGSPAEAQGVVSHLREAVNDRGTTLSNKLGEVRVVEALDPVSGEYVTGKLINMLDPERNGGELMAETRALRPEDNSMAGISTRTGATEYLSRTIGPMVNSIVRTVPEAQRIPAVQTAIRELFNPDFTGRVEKMQGQAALSHLYRTLDNANAKVTQVGALDAILKNVAARQTANTQLVDALRSVLPESIQPAAIATRRVDASKLSAVARAALEKAGMTEMQLADPLASFVETVGKDKSPLFKRLSEVEMLTGMKKAIKGVSTIASHTAIKANPPTRIFNGVSNYSIGEMLAADTGIPSPLVNSALWTRKGADYIGAAYAGKLGRVIGKDTVTGQVIRLGDAISDLGGDPVALAELRVPRGKEGAPSGGGRLFATFYEALAGGKEAVAKRAAESYGKLESAQKRVSDLTGKLATEETRVGGIANEVSNAEGNVGAFDRMIARHEAATKNARTMFNNAVAVYGELKQNKLASPESVAAALQNAMEARTRMNELVLEGQRLADDRSAAARNATKYREEGAQSRINRDEYRAELEAAKAVMDRMNRDANQGGAKRLMANMGSYASAAWEAYKKVPEATYSQGYFSDLAHRLPALSFLLERGYSYKAALALVKDRYLNYDANSNASKALSAYALPYFGFSAAAFPKQIAYMMKNPVRALVWVNAGDAAHRAWSIANDLDEEERQSMLRRTGSTPLYRGEDGELRTLDTLRGGTKTAIQEILTDAVAPGSSLGKSLSENVATAPIFPAIVRAATGNNPRTGRRDIGLVERVTGPLSSLSVPPYVRNVWDVVSGRIPENADDTARMNPLVPRVTRSGEKVPILSDIASVVTGARPRTFNTDKQVMFDLLSKQGEAKSTQRIFTELGELKKRWQEATRQGRKEAAADIVSQIRDLMREIGEDTMEINESR